MRHHPGHRGVGRRQRADPAPEGARGARDHHHPRGAADASMPSPYDAPMSDGGPLGNPFEGMPFLGDIAKLLGQQGGMRWDSARQLAISIATEGTSEPNVDPVERIAHRAAGPGGRPPRGRRHRPVHLRRRPAGQRRAREPHPLGDGQPRGLPAARRAPRRGPRHHRPRASRTESDDPMAGMFAGMLQMLQPMVLAMTAGSMVGHLGAPQPRAVRPAHPPPGPGRRRDELLLVVPNLDAFADEWSLARDDLRLWVCVHELAHHAVLGVPHVRATMDDLLTPLRLRLPQRPGRARGAPRRDRPHRPERPGRAAGAHRLTRPRARRHHLAGAGRRCGPSSRRSWRWWSASSTTSSTSSGGKLIASYPMLTEALRRRRVEAAEADRFVERLFGLELGQATYDRGAAFVDGVLERAGEDGLRRLWADAGQPPHPRRGRRPGPLAGPHRPRLDSSAATTLQRRSSRPVVGVGHPRWSTRWHPDAPVGVGHLPAGVVAVSAAPPSSRRVGVLGAVGVVRSGRVVEGEVRSRSSVDSSAAGPRRDGGGRPAGRPRRRTARTPRCRR